jgi:hypothetical protein
MSLTSSLLVKEIMRSYWDLAFLLGLREATIMSMRMKMSHHLHIVAIFKDGLIRLMVTPSGMMIRLMVSLSNMISSLPPISMSFIL